MTSSSALILTLLVSGSIGAVTGTPPFAAGASGMVDRSEAAEACRGQQPTGRQAREARRTTASRRDQVGGAHRMQEGGGRRDERWGAHRECVRGKSLYVGLPRVVATALRSGARPVSSMPAKRKYTAFMGYLEKKSPKGVRRARGRGVGALQR